jgi:hypothetical protein
MAMIGYNPPPGIQDATRRNYLMHVKDFTGWNGTVAKIDFYPKLFSEGGSQR